MFERRLFDFALKGIPKAHAELAVFILEYATRTLASIPHQTPEALRAGDGKKLILKTGNHAKFWLVLRLTGGQLRLEFPDKFSKIDSFGVFTVTPGPRRQGAEKLEKRVDTIPHVITDKDRKDCIAFLEGIHESCLRYYDLQGDATDRLKLRYGPSSCTGSKLEVPAQKEFAELLRRCRGCEECGNASGLNLEHDGRWRILCNDHVRRRSAWQAQGQRVIPGPVRGIAWHRDGGRCVECNSDIDIQFDHVIPRNPEGLAISGSNLETNLRLKCGSCNGAKGNKLMP